MSDEAPDGHVPDGTGRILVVCTANICRSPVAEVLLRTYLQRFAGPLAADVVVTSAGTHARVGDVAPDPMADVAATWGMDIRGHRSRPATQDVVATQDLVVTMEARHRDRIAKLAPGLIERAFTLTELAELLEAVDSELALLAEDAPDDAGARLRLAVAAAHAARPRVSPDAPDVEDPYGGPVDGYTTCAWELADLVKRVGDPLCAALRV